MAKTGNPPLDESAAALLQGQSSLLQLRGRMGATATGFASKHCKSKEKKISVFLWILKHFKYIVGSDATITHTVDENITDETENVDADAAILATMSTRGRNTTGTFILDFFEIFYNFSFFKWNLFF